MIKRIFLCLFVFSTAGILVTSCGEKKAEAKSDETLPMDMVAMRKIIDEKNAEFAKAFVSGDSTSMISHFTADGKLFPPNSPVVTGRNAIAKVIKQYLTYGIKEFKDETTSVYGAGEAIVEEGNIFMGDGKGNTLENGKYITIWKKVDGDWKVSSDIWNTSLPLAPTK